MKREEIAPKLRKLADSYTAKIEDLGRESDLRPTAKRMREAKTRHNKQEDLIKAQSILNRIADMWDNGTIPPLLMALKTKKDAEIMVICCKPQYPVERIYSSYEAELTKIGIYSAEQLSEVRVELSGDMPQVDQTARKIKQLEYEMMGNKSGEWFPTPPAIVDLLIADLPLGSTVLEPSAGNGVIADAARNAGHTVYCVELCGKLREILELKGHNLIGWDFMDFEPVEVPEGFDVVLMNPPFSDEVEHITYAFELLKSGGILRAVASPRLSFHTSKKYTDFKEWVYEYGDFSQLPSGSFKKGLNATGVETVLIELTKPV